MRAQRHHVTEADLIEQLKAHNDEAYREVLTRYGDALYHYVYNLSGNQHLSEDIVSETYLRLVERIDEFVYTGVPLKAWLYRIAHNLAINALKRNGQRELVSDAAIEDQPASDDPAALVAAQFEAAELRIAMTHLTDDQQQVVLLRFVADQSPAEVAQTLEKSETAVRQLQVRALRALARLLKRNDEQRPPQLGEMR
jgi:RNA polymerase sigma-70 factor (ECF subfamily)